MIEVTRDDNEVLDSVVKRFRRLVTRAKVLQEVKGRAHHHSDADKEREKRRRNNRMKKKRRLAKRRKN